MMIVLNETMRFQDEHAELYRRYQVPIVPCQNTAQFRSSKNADHCYDFYLRRLLISHLGE
jgi:hypothetical protein